MASSRGNSRGAGKPKSGFIRASWNTSRDHMEGGLVTGPVAVSTNLRLAREMAGLTQKEVAEAIGISVPTLRKYETVRERHTSTAPKGMGKTNFRSAEEDIPIPFAHACALAHLYGVPVSAIAGECEASEAEVIRRYMKASEAQRVAVLAAAAGILASEQLGDYATVSQQEVWRLSFEDEKERWRDMVESGRQ